MKYRYVTFGNELHECLGHCWLDFVACELEHTYYCTHVPRSRRGESLRTLKEREREREVQLVELSRTEYKHAYMHTYSHSHTLTITHTHTHTHTHAHAHTYTHIHTLGDRHPGRGKDRCRQNRKDKTIYRQ